jgi:hypothetical protein
MHFELDENGCAVEHCDDGRVYTWTKAQTEQAARDSVACRESRSDGSPSTSLFAAKLHGALKRAPYCDCACCQIGKLVARTVTR